MFKRFWNSRWPKRGLLVLTSIVAIGIFLGAVAPEPKLRPRDAKDFHHWSEDISTIAHQIDGEIDEAIANKSLQSSSPADWRTISRRLSLALVGNGMSLEEVRALEQRSEQERLHWWTDYLLADSRFNHYFAERLARAYVGTNEGPFVLFRRRKFRLWLAEELQKNTPYRDIVHKMISGEGLWTDKPEVNFITATMDEQQNGRADPIRLAGRTSRAFLGMRIDCLQCHNDQLGNINLGDSDNPHQGTQQDFHKLAAFFGGTRVAQNFLAGIRDDKSDYTTRFLDETDDSVVEPDVPFLKSALPSEGTARHRLADWVTAKENKAFARATVNRIWALMTGRPLVTPVDDIPLTGPYPAGLDSLADDFVDHDYDLKRLIRIIVTTRTFQRDSRLEGTPVSLEHEAAWAVFPITQLRPEQVAASLLQACRLQMIDDDSSIIAQLDRFGTVNDFTKEYGDRGEDEFNSQSITIPQRLLMMNGRFLRDRISNNPVTNAGNHIAMFSTTNEQAIEVAFLSVLNRQPTKLEKEKFTEALSDTTRQTRWMAIGGIYYVLLNSTEFLWNH